MKRNPSLLNDRRNRQWMSLTKTNNMKIKVGDKVRVSKDAPKMYYPKEEDGIVMEIEGEDALIKSESSGMPHCSPFWVLAVPTKYLIKVDAEAKEPKFKVGDKVKVNLPRSIRHNTIGTVVFAYASGNAVNVDFGDDNEPIYCDCDCLEPYTEPTEQTEAEKKPYDGISEETANEISNMLEAYAKALSGIADSFDWQRYEADLAKEVALKVANKYNDPEQAAEYAVSVAKAVVEGLKKK